jgi:nucleoside-diphosphate-sugar epimerase
LHVLILGCGYTGRRVAERFLARGAHVTATTRDPQRLAGLDVEVADVRDLPGRVRPGVLVVHSIPPDGPPGLLEALRDAPARMVYISSTAVYGDAAFADENTPVDGRTERARVRLAVEQSIAAGAWSSLILRSAAIYGPGRGVQESLRRGTCRVDDNFVSRIHVDDLATHVEAGLLSEVRGAYPVADEEPCTSREIAGFCAEVLNLRGISVDTDAQTARARANRRVDGSAIRRALGITLKYPSYRVGIPAVISV